MNLFLRPGPSPARFPGLFHRILSGAWGNLTALFMLRLGLVKNADLRTCILISNYV